VEAVGLGKGVVIPFGGDIVWRHGVRVSIECGVGFLMVGEFISSGLHVHSYICLYRCLDFNSRPLCASFG